MNSMELIAWATALYYCKQEEDSNPDVGWGPSDSMLLNRVEELAKVVFTDNDKSDILDVYKSKFNQR